MWRGYADILRKVAFASPKLGAWSYEVADTKLARETRGGTILQLCAYTELVGEIQGRWPERFYVVTPAGTHTFRFDDFGAFYRQIKTRLLDFIAANCGRVQPSTYPSPVDHCAVCRWSQRCNAQRRHDDHLSFVAGLGRLHEVELRDHGVTTLEALAKLALPLDFRPKRGAKETLERLREQARLQFEQRESGQSSVRGVSG